MRAEGVEAYARGSGKLVALRKKTICTSTTLQRLLAQEKNIKVSDSGIRKALLSMGYRWLPRAQKRKYSNADMKARLAFAKKVVRMGARKLKGHMAIAIDGVVLAAPPRNATDRENHCKHGESHMRRQKNEAACPDLAGEDPFAKQIPMSRALPLRAGISATGVAEILIHKTKKGSVAEWVAAVRGG